MNINDANILHECTSCQLCAAVCPKDAISIQLNKEGFYRPFIDSERCIDCGICVKVCYKYDSKLNMTTQQGAEEKKLFAAWAKDDALVKQTTSGGLGDLLARELVKEGYKVVGVIYNEDKTRAEHRIASSLEETISFRGSKYIQSYTFTAFKEVIATSTAQKYAVFGTPCQIYALNRFVERKKVRDNFIFIDLYCHGCPSLHIWTKYQKHVKEILGIRKFDKVEFRSKLKGWGGRYAMTMTKDDKVVFVNSPKNDGFFELFFCDQALNDACADCKLRTTLEYTDIRIGDFWGKKFLDNHRGVSAVSIVTAKGEQLFNSILNQVDFSECSHWELLPNQSWGKTYHPDSNIRKAILDSLSNPNETITDAVRAFRQRQGLKGTIVRLVKDVLYYLPQSVTTFLKKIK